MVTVICEEYWQLIYIEKTWLLQVYVRLGVPSINMFRATYEMAHIPLVLVRQDIWNNCI